MTIARIAGMAFLLELREREDRAWRTGGQAPSTRE